MQNISLAVLAFIGAAASSWTAVCHAQGRVATVRQKLDPLTNFRRIELRVDPKFTANCRQIKQRVTCDVSKIPERFPELMIGLRGGNMAGIEVVEGRRRLQLVFNLKKKELAFQSKVLPYPTRWVLEFGVPLVLLGTVEEQFPFRPYPVPATKLGAKLPPPNLHELSQHHLKTRCSTDVIDYGVSAEH